MEAVHAQIRVDFDEQTCGNGGGGKEKVTDGSGSSSR